MGALQILNKISRNVHASSVLCYWVVSSPYTDGCLTLFFGGNMIDKHETLSSITHWCNRDKLC